MSKKPKIRYVKIDSFSLKGAAFILIGALVLLQLASWVLTKWFGMTPLNTSAGFMLITIAGCVLLPYVMMDRAPHFTAKEVFLLMILFASVIFFLAFGAPKLMPDLFTNAMVGLKSLVGLP